MTRKQIEGIIRETLMAVAALMVVYQVGESALMDLVVPAVMGVVSLALGLRANEGVDMLSSAIRKLAVALLALAVRFELLPANAVPPIMTLVVSALAVFWSVRAKRPTPPEPPQDHEDPAA